MLRLLLLLLLLVSFDQSQGTLVFFPLEEAFVFLLCRRFLEKGGGR